MSDAIDIKVHGVEEFDKALRDFDKRIARRIVWDSLKQGVLIVRDEMKKLAPRDTGRLRRAIKFRRSKINTKKGLGQYSYYLKIFPGKKRNDRRGAYYGHIVDGGYNTKGTGKIDKVTKADQFGRRSGRKTNPGKTNVPGVRFTSRGYRRKRVLAVKAISKSFELGIEITKKATDL